MTTTLPRTVRVRQASVIHSEWTKLRSLPSTLWSLLAATALIVGFGALYCVVRVTRPPKTPESIAAFDPTTISLTGTQLAQLAVGVLGVLLITGEFATGTIRSSFAAVPRRLPVLWGKATTLALTTLLLCLPATIVAFLLGQSILSGEHLDTTLGQPGVTRAVIGSVLYLAAIALLGLGLGALLRTTAGGIGALFGVLFALPIVVGLLPESVSDELSKYLPGTAGFAIASPRPDPDSLAPWTGFGLLCLYVGTVLGLAAWRWRHRDA
jgi:ABC-type transport system involved in multi-copper enzyme maturation permease subunit